jgi:hypothetical protein
MTRDSSRFRLQQDPRTDQALFAAMPYLINIIATGMFLC